MMTIIHEKLKQRKTENYALKYAKVKVVPVLLFILYPLYHIYIHV